MTGNGTRSRLTAANERREARGLALKVLFESDLASRNVETVLERYEGDESSNAEQRKYCKVLVRGVIANLADLDEAIGIAAPTFPVDQLPAVDRNVLRIAIFELKSGNVPLKAAINEAVEIAKEYGGDNTSRFVNGVLGTIVSNMAAPQGSSD